MTEVVPAASAQLREAVFRFRYWVDIEQWKRHDPCADHERRRVTDPLDDTGVIFAATERGSTAILGTVRINFLGVGGAASYERLYGLAGLTGAHRETTSITTRLMIAPAYRGSPLAVNLAKAAYLAGLEAGIAADYIDCNTPLVPFFTRLGYRWVRVINHPAYGRVNLMRLDGLDRDHLISVRSPFLALLNQSPSAESV